MKGRALKVTVLLAVFVLAEINITAHIPAREPLENNLEQIIVVGKNRGEYETIQEAVDNAPEGSTVLVKAGSYNEIIDIKKAIQLIGENKETTIINPISEKNKHAIRLGAPGAIVKNLSIKNGAPGLYTTGVRMSASKTEIHNCNIYGTPVGIAIWTSDNIIDSCTFWECKDEGIALIGSQHSKCNNNTITNCTFHDNCDGIELQYSSNNTIDNCEFFRSTHTGIDAIASSNNDNTISNCEIHDNAVHGIYLSGSSRNKITACSISKNTDGNIVMNKNSFDNVIEEEIEPNPEINKETSNTSQIIKEVKEVVQTYHQSNEEIPLNSNIVSKILAIISNLISSLTKFTE